MLQIEAEKHLKKKLSLAVVKEALLQLPSYSLFVVKHKQRITRKYMERRAGHTLETDLAFITPSDGNFIGFILAIGKTISFEIVSKANHIILDIGSRFISTEPIQSKKKEVLEKEYNQIFQRMGTNYTIVQSDGELEFLRNYFKRKDMILR